MKKQVLLLTLLPLLMTACTNNAAPVDISDLTIVCPTGAPAVAFYKYATNDNFQSPTSDSPLLVNFTTGKYDVIVAPTKGGLEKIISQNAPYKLAATITFGNFYIVSTGHDLDQEMNAGDKIVAFQENDVPGTIFKYLYSDLNMDVTYVSGADATKNIIENGGVAKDELGNDITYDYVFTAQPVVAATNSTIFKNIQKEFKNKSGGKRIDQASIFIKDSVSKEVANKFLDSIKEDISVGVATPTLIKEEIEKLGSPQAQQGKFGVPGAMAMKVTAANNGFSLGFEKSYEIKDEIQSFMNLFADWKLGDINEEVYFK